MVLETEEALPGGGAGGSLVPLPSLEGLPARPQDGTTRPQRPPVGPTQEPSASSPSPRSQGPPGNLAAPFPSQSLASLSFPSGTPTPALFLEDKYIHLLTKQGGTSGLPRSRESVNRPGSQHPFPTYPNWGGGDISVADPTEFPSHMLEMSCEP